MWRMAYRPWADRCLHWNRARGRGPASTAAGTDMSAFVIRNDRSPRARAGVWAVALLWIPAAIDSAAFQSGPGNTYVYAAAASLAGLLIQIFAPASTAERLECASHAAMRSRPLLLAYAFAGATMVAIGLGTEGGIPERMRQAVGIIVTTASSILAFLFAGDVASSSTSDTSDARNSGEDPECRRTMAPSRNASESTQGHPLPIAFASLALGLLSQSGLFAGVSLELGSMTSLVMSFAYAGGIAYTLVSLHGCWRAMAPPDGAWGAERSELGKDSNARIDATVASSAEDDRKTAADPAPAIMALFSCGALLWNLFTRIVPISMLLSPLLAAASLATVALATAAWVFPTLRVSLDRAAAEDGQGASESDAMPLESSARVPSSNPAPPDPALRADFAAHNLTGRETAVILYALDGKTSQQTAEYLGIQAPTVRTYLTRAYRKLDIEDGNELRKRYARPASTPPEPSPLATPVRRAHGNLARFLLAGTGIMLLLPAAVPAGVWGAGQDRLLIMGWCLATLGFASITVPRSPRSGPRLTGITQLKASDAPPIACLVAIFELLPAPLSGIFLAACALGGLLIWVRERYMAVPHRQDPPAPLDSNGPIALEQEAATPPRPAIFICFGIPLGCAVEECWRSYHWFSFMPAALTFLVPIALASLLTVHAAQPRALPRAALACGIPFVSVLASIGDLPVALVAAALVVLLSAAHSIAPSPLERQSLCLGVGIGLLGGCIGVNAVGDIFTYHVGILGTYGTQTGFELATIALSTLVFAGGGLWFGRRMTIRARMVAMRRDLAGREEDEGLIRNALASYGLNGFQTATALMLLQGCSIDEIARELHYTPESVRNARRICFQRLRVSGVDAMRREVSSAIRCSQPNSND